MHGLHENFDASFFIGRTLERICFLAYQIHFDFDKHIGLNVEGRFSYKRGASEFEAHPGETRVLESNVMELLEHAVVGASGEQNGTLTLTFDNGHVLKCFDEDPYEAYQIHQGDKVIIV